MIWRNAGLIEYCPDSANMIYFQSESGGFNNLGTGAMISNNGKGALYGANRLFACPQFSRPQFSRVMSRVAELTGLI